MYKMFIRLTHHSKNQIDWLIIDKQHNQITDLNQRIINNSDIFVLVPGSDVFLTEVKLPKLSPAQLIKAIPYALEEHLVDDIANLHFAIGTMGKNNVLPVAVVTKKNMNEWNGRIAAFLKLQSPFVKMVVPETLILPLKPEQWTCFIDNEMVLVRTGAEAGFAIEVIEFWRILQLLLKHSSTTKPKILLISGELTIPAEIEVFLKRASISVEYQAKTNLLILAASSLDQDNGLNLLQGAYKKHHYFAKNKMVYRSTIILAIMCLSVLILSSILQFCILTYREQQLYDKILATFTQVFPDKKITQVGAMQRHLQQTLQAFKNTHNDNEFFNILSVISPVISQVNGVKLLGFDYTPNRLTLILEANDFLLLDKLSQSINIQNYKTEVNNAIKSADHVQALLIIQEKKL